MERTNPCVWRIRHLGGRPADDGFHCAARGRRSPADGRGDRRNAHKGIEKLRLTPRQINNGEMAAGRRVEFALLPQDEEHLGHLGLRWETLVDAGRRWLIIRNYPVPTGYRPAMTDIAIEVPVSYPGAQLDMFYCNPLLTLNSGAVIPQTQGMETVTGLPFQRWSRHRQWDAARDTLATHLALVDESLRREVER
jgi:hypothetical protein